MERTGGGKLLDGVQEGGHGSHPNEQRGSLDVMVQKVIRADRLLVVSGIQWRGLRDDGMTGWGGVGKRVRDGLGVSGMGGGVVTGYTKPTERKVKFREAIPGWV